MSTTDRGGAPMRPTWQRHRQRRDVSLCEREGHNLERVPEQGIRACTYCGAEEEVAE